MGCERWRLEGELYRVQEALVERLGPPSVMLRRRDHRLHNINTIEKTIQRLQQDPSTRSTTPPPQGRTNRSDTPPLHSQQFKQRDMDAVNANQVIIFKNVCITVTYIFLVIMIHVIHVLSCESKVSDL